MQGIYFVRSYFLFFLLLFCFFYNTLTQSNFLSVLYIQGGRTGVDDQLAICTQHFVGCAKKKRKQTKKKRAEWDSIGQGRREIMCVFTSKWVSYFLYIKNGRETNHVSSNKSKREEGTHEKKRGGKQLKNNDGIFFVSFFLL